MAFNKGDAVTNGDKPETGVIISVYRSGKCDVKFGQETFTCDSKNLKKIDSSCDSSAIVVVSSPVAPQTFKVALAEPNNECNFEDFLNGDCDYDDNDGNYISELEAHNAALQQQNDALIEQIQDMHHMQKSESSSKNSKKNEEKLLQKLTETAAKLYKTENENTVLKAALAAMEDKLATMERKFRQLKSKPFVPGKK